MLLLVGEDDVVDAGAHRLPGGRWSRAFPVPPTAAADVLDAEMPWPRRAMVLVGDEPGHALVYLLTLPAVP